MRSVLVIPIMLMLTFGGAVFAQSPTQPSHADDGHNHAPAKPAAAYTEAVSRIRDHLANARLLLGASKLSHTAEQADAIVQLGRALGRTALADERGVPRENVRDINLLGKEIAGAAEALHLAADANNASDAGTKLEALAALVARLGSISGAKPAPPSRWVCDMHCEPGRIFDSPGKCPICLMALKPIDEVPYSAAVSFPTPLLQEKLTPLTIRLLDPAGNPVNDLDIVHEQVLHLMVVSEDLSFYLHEHPVRQSDGSFVATIAFPFPGKYVLFHDFTPTGHEQVVPRAPVKVQGEAPPPVPLAPDDDQVKSADGLIARVRCNGGRAVAGADTFLRFSVDLQGARSGGDRPAPLEHYMGELGHLVIFSADLQQFVHSHPLSGGHGHGHGGDGGHDHAGHGGDDLLSRATVLSNGAATDIIFHAVFPVPGRYKAFAQFKHQGVVQTIPFTFDVVAPGDPAAAPASPTPHTDHSSHGNGHQ